MAAIHEFKCDKCYKKAPAKWNGQHWLFPFDWVELMDNNVYTTGQHLCEKCVPKKRTK